MPATSGPAASLGVGPSETPAPAHVPQLWALDRAGFPDPWSQAGWRDEVVRADRRWRVVAAEDRLVAAGGLMLAPDAAHVLRLVVAPAWRGRGIAVGLVGELIDLAARAGRPALTLEVRASNRAALNLYRRLGFVSHGVRPRYYADGEDAVVLWYTPPGQNPTGHDPTEHDPTGHDPRGGGSTGGGPAGGNAHGAHDTHER